MSIFFGIDQIILAVAIIINILLAGLVLRTNVKSATSIFFALLSIIVSTWLFILNLSSIPSTNPAEILLYTRLAVCFAVPESVLFFLLSHTVPSETMLLKKRFLYFVVAGTAIMMALTLSPYVFKGVQVVGNVITSIPGPAIPLFALFTTSFSLAAIYMLIKKFRNSTGETRGQLRLIMIGMLLMLGLITATILIPVLLFQNQFFISFAPLYALIFLGMTAYAIVKYHLFNTKVLATEALTSTLWILLLARAVFASTLQDKATNGFIFLGVFVFGLFLIKSVRREVEQREQLEVLNKQIAEKNAQLEDLSRFKSQLLSLASHQIKSPLAAIKGFVSLISDGSYGPVGDPVKETLKKVQGSADDLIGLINTLLDVRKVEEGKMEYKFERTDLNKMVGHVVELLKPLAEQKKLEFSFVSPGHEIWINADPEKFKQVAQNLIDNSIKYTPSGFVHVKLEEVADATGAKRAVISVTDSGLGVPAELLPHLFEEFIRDDRVKKEIRGTGLGLYIARKIAEAHGGKMNAASEGAGKGSTFSVSVPVV